MKVSTLRQRHPEHPGEVLDRYRALYEGGETWRAYLDYWLPQHDVEPSDRWEARKAHATYTNHVGAIVDFFAAHLFSEALSVDGIEDPWLANWLEDVDQAGTNLTDWISERFIDAMVGRTAYCWVDLPASTGEFSSLAEQVSAGALDAYLRPIQPEQVIWAERAGKRIAWLMIEEVLEERASVDVDCELVWRWTYIDDHVIRRWEWRPPRGEKRTPYDDEEAVELPPVLHGFGRLPVVELNLTSGLWAVAKLAEPAIAHLRARNDLSWALHCGALPLLVVATKVGVERPVLGAGYYLKTGPDDRVYYAEPSGSNYAILAEDVGRLREELYRTVQQLAQAADSSAMRTRLSAESKDRDWQAAEIVLAAYAARVKDAVREIVGLVAGIRKLDTTELQITGLEGWHQEDLATELEAMAMALDARAMSPRFKREAAKLQAERVLGGRVRPEVMDEIRQEIDAAPADDPSPWAPPPRSVVDGDEDDDAERAESAERGLPARSA